MPDGSEFLCPLCKVPLKEVRTSGGVFYGCKFCLIGRAFRRRGSGPPRVARLAKTQRPIANARMTKASRKPNEKRLSFFVQHLVSGPRSLRLSRVCGMNQ